MRALPLLVAVLLAGCAASESSVETTTALGKEIPKGSTVALHFDAPESEPAEDAPVDQREAYVLAKHLNEALPTFLVYEGLFENVVASDEQADYEMRIDIVDIDLALFSDNKTSTASGDVAEYQITLEDRKSQEIISAFRVDAAAKRHEHFIESIGSSDADILLQPKGLVDLSVDRILEALNP